MASYGVSIKLDTATPAVNRLRVALGGQRYRPAIGEAGKKVVMENFGRKEADPDSHGTARDLGARQSGLYADMAEATSFKVDDNGVIVSVRNDAVRQRLQGGTIKPTGGRKFLTIPANAAAYGKVVADFGDALEWHWFDNPRTGEREAIIVLPQDVVEQKTVRRKGKEKVVNKVKLKSDIYFRAVREVTQDEDPTVMPTDAELMTGIDEEIGDWLLERENG